MCVVCCSLVTHSDWFVRSLVTNELYGEWFIGYAVLKLCQDVLDNKK